MIGILTANVVLIVLAIVIATGILSAKAFSGAVTVLHKTIGITLPSPEKERTVAVIWIASMILIGDGMLLLLFLLTGPMTKG
jgi:hypothetical protein